VNQSESDRPARSRVSQPASLGGREPVGRRLELLRVDSPSQNGAVAASTGWLCDNVTSTPAGGGSATSSSQCYQVDASGNVLALKIVVQVNGQNVTFQ
jgi:hypothetical protein